MVFKFMLLCSIILSGALIILGILFIFAVNITKPEYAKDLFLNQSTLTGESMPVEKFPAAVETPSASPLETASLCLLGSNVESGSGTALVVLTGGETYFGSLAASIAVDRQ